MVKSSARGAGVIFSAVQSDRNAASTLLTTGELRELTGSETLFEWLRNAADCGFGRIAGVGRMAPNSAIPPAKTNPKNSRLRASTR